MGKAKKFFDKKKSATFQLMARDTSDPNYSSGPSGDRVFVRVDNNSYTPNTFLNEEEQNGCVLTGDPNSIFANAPEDYDDGAGNRVNGGLGDYRDERTTGLPDHVRRENLELGFPDDGYNYLLHMREIKNTGGGSSYYHNPKANLNELPRDVKAYDASRVEVSRVNDDSDEKLLYNVASRTVGARLQKVVDPEVAAMLDDSDPSKFGSDEDLEEDFVMRANFVEGPLDIQLDKQLSLVEVSKVGHTGSGDLRASGAPENEAEFSGLGGEKPRARRLLDEQFDLLELQEYGTDCEEEYSGYTDEENECQESLAEKFGHAFRDRPIEGLALEEAEDIAPPQAAADVIRRCKEYAEKYENENPDQEAVLVEESSGESEIWDCETIVSTYSNLDNHPAKIAAPGGRRKKKLAETISGAQSAVSQMIVLKGREKLPVGFLPQREKHDAEKVKDSKDPNNSRTELQKRKPRSLENKEEKKERKGAVKAERLEARQMKKNMKGSTGLRVTVLKKLQLLLVHHLFILCNMLAAVVKTI